MSNSVKTLLFARNIFPSLAFACFACWELGECEMLDAQQSSSWCELCALLASEGSQSQLSIWINSLSLSLCKQCNAGSATALFLQIERAGIFSGTVVSCDERGHTSHYPCLETRMQFCSVSSSREFSHAELLASMSVPHREVTIWTHTICIWEQKNGRRCSVSSN